MKIILAGGTGQVGSFLAEAFHTLNHEVIVLSRSPKQQPWRTVQWTTNGEDTWAEEIDGSDVVINLAGRSVNCRYNEENRKQIVESRTLTTAAVGKAIEKAKSPPKVWVNSSTATIYQHTYDDPNDEANGIVGVDEGFPDTWEFSYNVAVQWEAAMERFELPQTRKIKARMAMVMGSGKEGVFDVLMGLAKKGLGGTLGNGKQYMSWIHELDFLRAIQHTIEDSSLEGPVNMCSPHPLPNKAFMKEVREVANAPFGLPAMDWMLEIGAVFLKTETELLLKSRKVIPGKLTDGGFKFLYPHWKDAAVEIRQRHKENIGFHKKMLD